MRLKWFNMARNSKIIIKVIGVIIIPFMLFICTTIESFAAEENSNAVVTGLMAKAYTYNSIRLSWNPVDDALGYNIYREQYDNHIGASDRKNQNEYKLLTSIRDGNCCEYIDNNINGEYYYTVAPIFNESGKETVGNRCIQATGKTVDVSSSGSVDQYYPVLTQFEILNKELTTPGTLDIYIKASDEGSGIKEVMVEMLELPYSKYRAAVSYANFNHEKSIDQIIHFPFAARNNASDYVMCILTISDDNNTYCFKFDERDSNNIITLKDEFDIEFTGTLSNTSLENELSKMDEGKAVLLKIDEYSKGVIKKECLDAIAGQDKKIIVYCDDSGSLQWVFDGKKIIGDTKDLNLNVSLTRVNGDIYGSENDLLRLDYYDNGQLPGYVEFRIKSDYIRSLYNISNKLFLYHILGNELNYESDCDLIQDGENTSCSFELNHNSSFVLSGQELGKTIKSPVKNILVTQISLTGISKKIAAGKKIQLTANVLPENATDKAVTWKSSNPKVATVTQTGIVTIKKKTGGKYVTITATAKNDSKVKATYKIKSMKGVVKKVAIKGKSSVKAGKKLSLKAKVKASKGANNTMKWTSNNEKYATVSSKGVVKALKTGRGKYVTITAEATDGSGKKATKRIKIK